jgi:hypothetical protein
MLAQRLDPMAAHAAETMETLREVLSIFEP